MSTLRRCGSGSSTEKFELLGVPCALALFPSWVWSLLDSCTAYVHVIWKLLTPTGPCDIDVRRDEATWEKAKLRFHKQDLLT